MSKLKTRNTNWKRTAVEVFLKTPQKKGRPQWNLIAKEVVVKHKEDFEGCKEPNEKIRLAFKSKEVKEILEQYQNLKEAAQKTAVTSKTKCKKKQATTAHINDEDKDTENEDEVVSIEDVEETINKDGSRTKTVDILTLDDAFNMDESKILKILGYNPEIFKLVSSSCRKGTWNAQSKGGKVIDLYSFRLNANVRPLGPEEIGMETVKNVLIDSLSEDEKSKLLKVKTINNCDGDKIAILSIADLHLGKLAWSPECGESYDHKIATKRFNFIINSAISRLRKEEGIEKIIFFWCQDFFHFDTPQVTTTAGTRQDSDIRWAKMFEYGTKMLIEAIQHLSKIAPVHTFYVRSNHDTQTSFYACSVLKARFCADENIIVDATPSPRKYIRYGVNLMGFGHGDKEGKRINSLMSIEMPVDWGQTWNHEYFLGHFHSLKANDDAGVLARYLASPTGTDAWHNEEGFLGAQKEAQLFIRGKNEGKIAEFTIHVD